MKKTQVRSINLNEVHASEKKEIQLVDGWFFFQENFSFSKNQKSAKISRKSFSLTHLKHIHKKNEKKKI